MPLTTSNAVVPVPVPSSPFETINPDVLPPQLRELTEAEGDTEPSLEEIEHILKVYVRPSSRVIAIHAH